jgi:hypothetical protein
VGRFTSAIQKWIVAEQKVGAMKKAEDWLEPAALKRVIKKKPILEHDSDVEVVPNPLHSKATYDRERLDVVLPGSDKVERIKYVPPKLNYSRDQISFSSAAEPAQAIFEHFHWTGSAD